MGGRTAKAGKAQDYFADKQEHCPSRVPPGRGKRSRGGARGGPFKVETSASSPGRPEAPPRLREAVKGGAPGAGPPLGSAGEGS